MLTILREVFSKKKYIAIFLTVILVSWVAVGIYQHGETLWSLASVLSFSQWLLFALTFSDFIVSNTSTPSLIALVLNIIGIALYITVKVFAYTLNTETRSVEGIFGAILVFFGIGCASCGSLALVSIASLLGFGSALVLLPFGGHEIIFIALVLLIISNVIMLRQLAKKVCPV